MDNDIAKTHDTESKNLTEDTPTVEDTRSALDKKLEQIESIEAKGAMGRPRREANQASQSAIKSSQNTEERPDVVAEPAEDPSIVAARETMRAAERNKAAKNALPKRSKGLLVLLVVVILGMSAALAWMWYQQNQTKEQLSSTQTSLGSAEASLAVLKQAQQKLANEGEAGKSNSVALEESSEQEYKLLPEWDVRYELNEQTKDLGYGLMGVQPGEESLGFYSIELARSAGSDTGSRTLKCGVGSLGQIARLDEKTLKEQYPDKTKLEGISHKQIGAYTYIYQESQSPCSTSSQKEQMAISAVNSIFETLEPIEQS
jgi:hypothetical protein